jgi:hypothetical protein
MVQGILNLSQHQLELLHKWTKAKRSRFPHHAGTTHTVQLPQAGAWSQCKVAENLHQG